MKRKKLASILYFCICLHIYDAHAQTEIHLNYKADSVFTFTDTRDSKNYKAAIINNTTWMIEPVRYKTSDSWCYNGKLRNCKTYGRLYNWFEAKNACPNGWHLPSKVEWDNLMNYLGTDFFAGTYFIKSDTSIFKLNLSYPPNIYGRFGEEANEIHMWSSTEYNTATAWQYYIVKDYLPAVSSYFISKNYRLTCLCVKNE